DHIASLIGPEKADAVNYWMDHVPGTDYIGGGWLHRLQHGHDLSAVTHMWWQHGSGGGLEALYHIYGRDFFTPAGIPILPAGSEHMHEFLTGDLHLSSLEAAHLLSINAVELLGGILSVLAIVRLTIDAQHILEDWRIAKLVGRATTALENKDFLTGSHVLREARALKPRDARLSLLLAA